MAQDQAQALIDALQSLSAKLDTLSEFAANWRLKEQQPGLFSKIPVTLPWRPYSNRTLVMPITAADTSIQLEQGIYDLTADNDCFIELNQNSSLTGSYPLRGGLVYGGLRIIANDTLHLIATVAGGNLYISPVS